MFNILKKYKKLLQEKSVLIDSINNKCGNIASSLDSANNKLDLLESNYHTELRKRAVLIDDYTYTPYSRTSLISSFGTERIFNQVDVTSLIQLITQMGNYRDKLTKIPLDFNSADVISPYWMNGWIPPLDAISIYTMLAIHNPRFYVECGSGNTTKFAYRSIQDNKLRTKIISIDPYPRAEIDQLCEKIFRIPFEDMDLNFFDTLTCEDIFVIDNSHRSLPNSDVTVFFTEVLPKLPNGLIYTLHDIMLPYDYPSKWSVEEKRWYNEQYLLFAYLLGGAMGDSIYFPCSYAAYCSETLATINSVFNIDSLLPSVGGGGFFWMKKKNTHR